MEMAEAGCKESCGTFKVKVQRYDGSKGTITCKYRTADKDGALSKVII